MEEIRIYIAEQRCETALANGWIRSTFNYGKFQDPDKRPFEALRHLNEWGGAKGQVFSILGSAGTSMVLLPTVGGITVSVAGTHLTVDLGQLLVLPITHSVRIEVSARDQRSDGFCFIHLVVNGYSDDVSSAQSYPLTFHPTNTMVPVLPDGYHPFQFHVGAFRTKQKDEMSWSDGHRDLFAFTLSGCFEIEGRLLFTGDGLGLSETGRAEIECLSATGLILVTELARTV